MNDGYILEHDRLRPSSSNMVSVRRSDLVENRLPLACAFGVCNGVAQSLRALVWAAKRDRCHHVAQHAGSDRVALGVVGIQ